LIASLAFNVGVGVTFGVQAYHKYATPDRPDAPRRGRGLGHGPRRMHGLEKLNLTPEQQAHMEAARDSFFVRVRELRRTVREQHEALTELMSPAEPDREAIAVQIDEISRLRAEMDWSVVEHFLDMKQLLDPEQHEAFNDMIHRAFSRGGPGHGPFGGHGGRHKGPGHKRRGALHQGDE
jgi:Spy/CpxP family protein refolding chaperone